MNIGIIGSGNVGGTLGTRWAKGGHQVTFGSRDPGGADMQQLVARAGATARAATLQDAAKSGEVLLLSTPWPVTKEIVQGLGDLTGKVLIDAVNPLLPDLSGMALPNTTSGAEQVGGWARGAKVVKAFNTVGSNIME
ncbi:MAG TPA: NAD(P)-binding domain-containing protein, partial [Bryobacteraceae bacterium]|nr:NAD(P)-binding domain-containing protein [Bryobacteraceae bacterium]